MSDDEEALAIEVRRRGNRNPAPQQIGDVILRLMARQGYAQLQAHADWTQAWEAIVGLPLSHESRVGKLHRGVLEILVRNSIVLQELTFKKRDLLEQLRTTHGQIRDVKFRIAAWE